VTGPPATQFGSDNYAGVCPEAWAALAAANAGHAPAYGADDWTAAAVAALQRTFETDCAVYFVFNGTAANALALAAICRPSDAIVCHEMAHVNVDECGAPGFFSGGAVLRTADTPLAKLTPEAVERLAVAPHDEHSSRPRALALTQATELGTVYTPLELWQLADCAHGLGMKVQQDGARFANAVATLDCAPADISWRAGVDVLCLGGTKNGLPFGEAILFFDPALADEFAPRAARQRDGRAACRRHRGCAGRPAAGAGRGERRVRRPPGAGDRRAARQGLALLPVRRRHGRAPDVRVGHGARHRRRARRRRS
jgi:threonine aldolase